MRTEKPKSENRWRPTPARLAVWPLFILVWSLGVGAQAQVEETVEPATYGESTDALEADFETAMGMFNSIRQAESIPLFSSLIEEIAGAQTPPPGRRRDLLTQALFRRAEAHLNLGENDAAEADLAQVASVDPAFDAGALRVSPKLAELFEQARAQVAGYLEPRLDPADAEVRLDGARVELRVGDTTPVLAGSYRLSVERPGYAPLERDLEIAPGATLPIEATLERDSATVRVRTAVEGVEVSLDGTGQGLTHVVPSPVEPDAMPDEAESEDASAMPEVEPLAPPTAELVVAGLTLGNHLLELSKEGYRSGRVAVTVEELTDYELEIIELEETRGTLQVLGLPADASLVVDGEVLFPAGSADGDLSLPLSVGEHLLEIDAGTLGGLVEYFSLEDRGEVTVTVRLKPRLVLLGILGSDPDAERRLRDGLAAHLDGHENWLYVDGSQQFASSMEELGLEAGALRSPAGDAGIDWQAVQASAGGLQPGSVYLLAVLSDDLLAGEAVLWTIPASPSPALAERARVGLASETGLDDWASGFATPAAWSHRWLGAVLLDSGLAEGPVIAHVDPSGPVAEAGGQAGEVVDSIDGRQVSSAAEVVEALAAASDSVALSVMRGGEPVTLTVPLVDRPAVVVDLDSSSPVAATLAWISIEEARGATPAWVLALNRAAAYRRHAAWPEMIRSLRGVEAPQQDGIGQAAVDYWLGVALLETDPASYREQAVEALRRAAEAESGRLGSADGPRVADRARARLEALGATQESAGD